MFKPLYPIPLASVTAEAGKRAKRAVHSKRRALREKAATPEGAEPVDREAVWRRYGGHCHLCKLPVPLSMMTLDHVVPLAEGGSNTEDNLAPAHTQCNVEKGARVGPRKKRGGLRRTPFKRKPRPPMADEGDF